MASALTQGIGVVTGLQQRFDWRGVAGSAAGAAVGAAFGDIGVEGSENAPRFDDEGSRMPGAGPQDGTRYYSSGPAGSISYAAARFMSSVVGTGARGLASAVARGGHVSFDQIAVDAFGNALGESMASGSSGVRGLSEMSVAENTPQQNFRQQEISEQNARARADAMYGWNTGHDGLGFKPVASVGTVGMRYQGLQAVFTETPAVASGDPNSMLDFDPDGKWNPDAPQPVSSFDRPTNVAFLPFSPFNPLNPLSPLNPGGVGGIVGGGYKPVRPDGAGGPPPYDIVRDLPSGAPASMPSNPSLGLGVPPQQATEKPWFDRAIEGMPIGVKAATGLMQLITTKVGEALGAATPAQGGTYVLKDEEGNVVRTGRTNDFDRRAKEHFRNPALWDYIFEEVHRTDDYREQRGLEHRLHETYNPPLNKIRPINPSNKRMPDYLDAADEYLRRQGK
jgi:hypothetical protein